MPENRHIRHVPAEVRGIVRRWKKALTVTSDPIYESDQVPGAHDALEAVAHKKGVGRDRGIKKIRRLLPAARLSMLGPNYSVWAFLAPCEPILQNAEDEGEKQPAVSVNFLFGGKVADHFVIRVGQWSLEIPDHALHRLVQRWPNCDLAKTLWEAHRNVLSAKAIRPLPEYEQQFNLPAGDGVFAGQFVFGRDKQEEGMLTHVPGQDFLFYFRARTWLHQDQLYDQQAVLTAGTPPMGDAELLPKALREAAYAAYGHLINDV